MRALPNYFKINKLFNHYSIPSKKKNWSNIIKFIWLCSLSNRQSQLKNWAKQNKNIFASVNRNIGLPYPFFSRIMVKYYTETENIFFFCCFFLSRLLLKYWCTDNLKVDPFFLKKGTNLYFCCIFNNSMKLTLSYINHEKNSHCGVVLE